MLSRSWNPIILLNMQISRAQESARFWDRKAKGYAKSAIADIPAYERTLERTRAHLGRSGHVLELGCGTGTTALHLAPHVGQVTASDISAEMVSIARDKAQAQGVQNVEFVAAGAHDQEVMNRGYDAVLAFNLLHLVDDVPGLLAQIHRALKPGGLFISKTFCLPDGFSAKVAMIRLALPLMKMFKQAPSVQFWRVHELDELVLSAGFSVVEQGAYPENPPRRFLVVQKNH